jgi:hypothetical protein
LTPHHNPTDDLDDCVDSQQQQQQDNPDNVVTVEAYVAAMEEKDAQDRSVFDAHMEAAATAAATDTSQEEDGHEDDIDQQENDQNAPDEHDNNNAPTAEETAEAATVGVKSHSNPSNSKKSNAVGDPDGEGSDDSDDDTDDWEDMDIFEHGLEQGELQDMDLIGSSDDPATQVQVELELLEANQDLEEANSEEEEPEEGSSSSAADATRGGGVGVRLGRLNRRKHRNTKDWRSSSGNGSSTQATKTTVGPEELLEAWLPHVYLPPTASAVKYLTEHARTIDGASKTRLDRRTMYAGLLLEWRNANGSPSARKFLEQPTSQALQAALSLATQPAWRKSFPRPSGIRLYDNDQNAGGGTEQGRCATLAMQETIAMALVSKQRTMQCNVM